MPAVQIGQAWLLLYLPRWILLFGHQSVLLQQGHRDPCHAQGLSCTPRRPVAVDNVTDVTAER